MVSRKRNLADAIALRLIFLEGVSMAKRASFSVMPMVRFNKRHDGCYLAFISRVKGVMESSASSLFTVSTIALTAL